MALSDVNENEFVVNTRTHEVTLPSGKKVTIRERNGNDEDILSNMGDFKDGLAIPKFLSGIIVSEPTPASAIQQWGIRDKYYLLLKERILSLGTMLIFTHKFESGSSQTFEEDLSKYDWDYNLPVPKYGDKNYNEDRALPYPSSMGFIEGRTSSGKNFRMKYLTGDDEIKTLGMDQRDLSVNKRLTLRNFELQTKTGKWLPIERFDMLTGPEMQEIRDTLDDADGDFSLIVQVKDPNKGVIEETSLMQEPDFFIPRGSKKRKR